MKQIIDWILIRCSVLYLAKKHPRVVIVSGSVGKTSTTQALATMLAGSYRVKTTRYNYNTLRGVVMSIFDEDIQTSPLGWMALVARVIMKSFFLWPRFNMLVLEVGTERPGELAEFAFLHPELALVTAITPEHMEFFGTIDAVAKEELSVGQYSPTLLVNTALVDHAYIEQYVPEGRSVMLYGAGSDVYVENGLLHIHGEQIDSSKCMLVGRSGETIIAAVAASSSYFGQSTSEIADGLARLHPTPGRMNILSGKNGSVIIDDTYNSSPEAVSSALEYLYGRSEQQKIAVLGMMNELGEQSESLHRQVGRMCDPDKLTLLVTLGAHANQYIAAEAEKRGCKVLTSQTPKEAAEHIVNTLSNDTVVLVKGSQNGVYAEEAAKLLLANSADQSKLVRQHGYWPKKKGDFFINVDG